MASLPIKALTLFKHGVGHFQRAGAVDKVVELLVERPAMNDILKSLTVAADEKGRLLEMEYSTPTNSFPTAVGRSIELSDGRALRDFLLHLRGIQVEVHLVTHEVLTGKIMGLDETPDLKIAATVVSLYRPEIGAVVRLSLRDINHVEILDRATREDVAHYLASHNQDDRFSTIQLHFSPATTQAELSYIAPAPTWRVSYRLVSESLSEEGQGEAVFQGWAIFDNTLDEALENISLSLVSGMPISFTYGLYHPNLPNRPHFEDENRTIDQEISFDAAMPAQARMATAPMAKVQNRLSETHPEAIYDSVRPESQGESLGELFAYRLTEPVSVGRGRSAMVPVFQTKMAVTKKLIYNSQKYQAHPVAVFEAQNASGGPLERGPITVFENGNYLGDAIVNFTAAEETVSIPYAIELGVHIKQQTVDHHQKEKVHLRDAFLIVEEWHIRTTTYEIHNKLPHNVALTIEHSRETQYNLETTPSLQEETFEYWRFFVAANEQSRKKFQVVRRRLIRRKQALNKLAWRDVQQLFNESLLDERSRHRVRALLDILEPLEKREEELSKNSTQQENLRETQRQIQGNLASLGNEGREGALRLRYVQSLEEKEDQLEMLAAQAKNLEERIVTLKNLLASQLQSWVEKNDSPGANETK